MLALGQQWAVRACVVEAERIPRLPPAGVLLAAAALPPAAAQDCRARLLEVSPGSDASVEFVDVETPSEACTKRLDGFDATYQVGAARFCRTAGVEPGRSGGSAGVPHCPEDSLKTIPPCHPPLPVGV